MRSPLYIVDAFTNRQFAGNQAGVLLLDKSMEESDYQTIAKELNLPMTACLIPSKEGDNFEDAASFDIRWFTPTGVQCFLCGHASLAVAHVLFNEIGNKNDEITFKTVKSETLSVTKSGKGVEMNFPLFQDVSVTRASDENSAMLPLFNAPDFFADLARCVVPKDVDFASIAFSAAGKMLIVAVAPETTRAELESWKPDNARLLALHPDGSQVMDVLLTCSPANAKAQGWVDDEGEAYDYACRVFSPWYGIDEDPATGSAQCAMAPFWGKILGKSQLYAYQAFPGRGAHFRLSLQNNGRIAIFGHSVTVVSGNMHL